MRAADSHRDSSYERDDLTLPDEDLEAILARHSQIEQQQVGQRIFLAAGVTAGPLQVGNDLLAIRDDMMGAAEIIKLEFALQERDFGLVIFRDQNKVIQHGRLYA